MHTLCSVPLVLVNTSQTVKENGGIDILVSNAAVSPHFGPMLEVSVCGRRYFVNSITVYSENGERNIHVPDWGEADKTTFNLFYIRR